MTVSINVSVNGSYKLPVKIKQGNREETLVVSGRGHEGPNVQNLSFSHGPDVMTVEIGPEEYDHGEPEAEAGNDLISTDEDDGEPGIEFEEDEEDGEEADD